MFPRWKKTKHHNPVIWRKDQGINEQRNATKIENNDATYEVGWQVDRGQVRESNEDEVGVVAVPLNEDEHETIGIVAVADGAGGHPKGELASKLAVHTATHRLAAQVTLEGNDDLPPNYQQWLHNAVLLANRVLHNKNKETPRDMLTTLVMAAVVGDEAHIVNVGDSRAYIVRATGIEQITKDHSLVQFFVEEGEIAPEEAADHPRRNVLTQAIGQDNVSVDLFEVTLEAGDYLLLCSDGLWGELKDEQIWRIIRQSDSVQGACQSLVTAANAAGGRDNIAVVLVQTERESAH